MKPNRFLIKIDTLINLKNDYFEIVAGDYLTNMLDFEITQNEIAYDLTGLGIEIDFAKRDGNVNTQDMNLGVTITDEIEGKVSCELAPNSTNVEGRIRGEIKIYQGITLLTTRRFEFFVRNPLVKDGIVESTTEMPILVKLIAKYDGMVLDQIVMIEAELEREVNEDNRILLNQQLLLLQTNLINLKDVVNTTNNLVIEAENIRVDNEILRQELKTRVEALQGDLELLLTSATDTIDIVNQSATNADSKADLANTAASNVNSIALEIQATETLRVNAESARATAEGLRVIAEGTRNTSETARVLAETGRMALINSKASQVDFLEHKIDYTTERAIDNLKVATIEKELDDYQSIMANVNVNQEAKLNAVGYGVVSLPKNTANGNVGVSVKGITLKNELNYNRDTWAEWTKSAGVIGDTTGIEITSDGTAYPGAKISACRKNSTKYGILYNIVSNNSTSLFKMNGGVFPLTTLTKTIGNNKIVLTTVADTSAKFFEFILYPDIAGTKIKTRDMRAFELPPSSQIETDFNTLTADQLAIKYPYIKGDKVYSTVSANRIKSVGKNLFDGEFLNGQRDTVTGAFISTQISKCTGLIKVVSSESYTTTGLNSAVDSWASYYDANRNFITRTGLSKKTNSINAIPNNGVYMSWSIGGSIIVDFQIEQGTVATPYEPYTESITYLPNIGELRSLPNGTKDEVRVSGGKAEHIQRNGKIKLQVSDISFRDTYVNITYAVVNIPSNYIYYSTPVIAGGTIVLENYTADADNTWDSISHIGKYYGNAQASKIWVGFVKGTTLLQAQTALTGLELTYQLAQEIITPIDVSGTLLSYPSGTVYIENVVADAGIYSNGITILDSTLPIASIDKLSEWVNGVLVPLDISLTVINVNKLSFTHPNLVNGDIVFFEYYHSVESTLGETTITYLDSRHTIKDTTNGKFYQWVIKSTNGVPTTILTEVL